MSGAVVQCFHTLSLPVAESREWDDLLGRMPAATVFQSLAWLQEWFPVYGEGWSPLILRVAAAGGSEVLGYAPLMVGRGNFLKRVMPDWREVRLIGDREPANSDFGGFICREDRRQEFMDAVLTQLWRRNGVGWDVLRLSNLADEQYTGILQSMRGAGMEPRVGAEQASEALFIRLPGTMEEFQASQDGRFRRNLRRRLNRLTEQFPMRFELIRGLEAWQRFRSEALSLHREWYRTRVPGDPGAGFLEFLDRVSTRLGGVGALRVHLMLVRDRIAAFNMGFVQGRRFYGYQKASRTDLERFSPDSLLLNQVIESSIGEGIERIEMGQGGEEYKQHWANDQRPLWNLTLSNRTFRGRLQYAAFRLRRWRQGPESS